MERSVSGFGMEGTEEVREYRVHVSSKYLDLTRKKLELTRLPHELESEHQDEAAENESNWALGAPKGVVEPLVDYWLETYSFRHRESHFNTNYPQYRTSFPVPNQTKELRIHFIHLRSPHASALPLLLIPAFPLTNLSIPLSLLKALTSPDGEEQGFHLVIPSIPGLGFSDAFTSNEKVLEKMSGLFDGLMKRLGYEFYLCSATGSGRLSPGGVDYHLPRLLAERFAGSCLGVHLIDPLCEQPTGWEGWKFKVAGFWHAGIWGYQPSDFVALKQSRAGAGGRAKGRSLAGMLGLREPDTLAYALCDSPVGILSFVASALRRTSPAHTLGKEEIVDLVTLAWLPGPEAGMRVLCAAEKEKEELRVGWGRGKVALSVFDGVEEGYTPPAWASVRFDVVWTQRVEGRSGLVVFERESVIVDGVGGLAKAIAARDGRLKVQSLREVVVPREVPVVEDLISLSEVMEEEEDEEESVMQLDAESPATVVAVPLGSN